MLYGSIKSFLCMVPLMKMTAFMKALAASAAIVVGAMLSPASAAIYQQPFDTVGGLPSDWAVAGYFNASYGSVAVETISAGGEATGLRLQRTVGSGGAAGNSFVYYTGSFGDVTNGVLSDFTGSAVVRMQAVGKNASEGFMVRTGEPNGTSANLSGYFVAFSRGDYSNDTPGMLEIYKNPNGATGKGTLLQSVSLDEPLFFNTDYLFEVRAVGTMISGFLYKWDDDTDSFSKLLGQISVEDGTYSSGLFGFRTTHDGGNQSTLVQDLKIETIPEPGAAAFFVPAGLAFLVWKSRRR